jgi:hypothetical protein
MDHAGDIIQRADGHTSKMEALAPDSPLLNELNFFSGTGKPDRCNPACRPTPEDSYHRDFPKLAIRPIFIKKKFMRFFMSYPGFRILPGNGIASESPV